MSAPGAASSSVVTPMPVAEHALVAPVRVATVPVNSLRVLSQSLSEVRVAVEKLAALLPVLTAAEGAIQNVIASASS